jgi:phosphoglycolate phosphatase-like HAD superfamily hydrolase
MRNKKYIIFDFDGTIADTIPVMLTIVSELAQEIGYTKKITAEDLEWVREHEIKDIPGKFGIPFIKIPYLLLKGRDLLNKQMFSVPPCKGILEMLQTLKEKGYKLAILSSNRRDSIQEFIVKHNLASYFDFVHSELNIFGKDKALLSLMKQYQMPINESIYVGDEMRDIEACRKIKLDCISAAWGLNSANALKNFGAKWIVVKPQEIINILLKP